MGSSPQGRREGGAVIGHRVILHRAPIDECDLDCAVHRLDLGWGEEGGGGAGGATHLPQPGAPQNRTGTEQLLGAG